MGRRCTAVLAGVILWAALLPGGPGGPGVRAEAASDGPSPSADGPSPSAAGPGYAFAQDAVRVRGAAGTTDAVRLDAGLTYRSTLPDSGTAYYRLDLDATTTSYVSATAVPEAGAEVSSGEGVKVSVQDADGLTCSTGTTRFGATRSPHPITAWASRDASGGPGRTLCQGAGTFYVVVERVALTDSPSRGAWELDLTHVSEPSLRTPPRTRAPQAWDSATPEPVGGRPVTREGGAGFASAAVLGQGVWQTRIAPGQTFYYRVPLDWGRQLAASVELGSADPASRGSGSGTGPSFLGTALVMTLYNPVRGYVDDVGLGYDGTQRTTALRPLPPVDYANRYDVSTRTGAMRFAGSYYLVVHLAGQTADTFGDGPFGLTLRIGVRGEGRTPPDYAGTTRPEGVFDTGDGRDGGSGGSASGGTSGQAGGAGGDTGGQASADDAGQAAVMRVVAASGIGGGTVLLLILSAWTVVARRRDRAWRRQDQTRSVG